MSRHIRCTSTTGRHHWQPAGLDIRHEDLVTVSRCAICGAEKTRSYEFDYRRHQYWISPAHVAVLTGRDPR